MADLSVLSVLQDSEVVPSMLLQQILVIMSNTLNVKDPATPSRWSGGSDAMRRDGGSDVGDDLVDVHLPGEGGQVDELEDDRDADAFRHIELLELLELTSHAVSTGLVA